MKTAFLIFLRGLGIYALATLPLILLPIMYIVSMYLALVFSWASGGLFILIAVLTNQLTHRYLLRLTVYLVAVPLSVAFAYQMIETCGYWEHVWREDGFLLFPMVATLCGIGSVLLSRERLQVANPDKWSNNKLADWEPKQQTTQV